MSKSLLLLSLFFLVPIFQSTFINSYIVSKIQPHIFICPTTALQCQSLSISSNLHSIQQSINHTLQTKNRWKTSSIRLVAVSKNKSIEKIQEAYQAGQRVFAENYIQELLSKYKQLHNYKDIQWHFIGTLQIDKAEKLISTLGLYDLACIETVSSTKLANKLHTSVIKWLKMHNTKSNKALMESTLKLKIYLQINTSYEESKYGIMTLQDALHIVEHITTKCPFLEIRGLMTIGKKGDPSCFTLLDVYRTAIAKKIGIKSEKLELSMGMSQDYEMAITLGATNVRIGEGIFGKR